MNVRRALARLPAPDEAGAQARAWAVVREAYGARPARAARRAQRRLALAPALAALVIGLAFTPAGASVRTAISHALRLTDTPARHAPRLHLTGLTLPAPGQLLLSGPRGTWTVAGDGSKHFIGPWTQATWSPRHENILVAGAGELAAVTPSGRAEWILWRPDVHGLSWYAPSGYRIAYVSGRDLRVAVGNGTGDHLLAAGVQPVAPAWRPDHPYELAFSPQPGWVALRQAAGGLRLWRARAPGAITALQWSADGGELLALTTAGARIYDPRGRTLATVVQPDLAGGALSPDGRTVALLRGPDVILVHPLSAAAARLRVLSAAGLRDVLWSPDGRWLLLDWPAADEWLFVRAAGGPQILAEGAVSRQLGAGGTLPALDGWCCTAAGGPTK